MMKRLILILVMMFVVTITACGKNESKTANESGEATIEPTIEATIEPTVEPTVEATIEPTVEPTVEATIEPTVEPTVKTTTEATIEPTVEPTIKPTAKPTVKPTKAPTKAPEKKYDVYVNGKGFNIGDKVDVKVSIKANDKNFVDCCTSLNFYKEGVKDAEKIEAAIEIDYDNIYENPELFSPNGDCTYYDSCYSLWAYYNLIAKWDNPDAPPMDVTGGVHMYTYTVTFKEAGKYTVEVVSGNGAEGMEEEFAKYDNCFFVEISKKD